MTSPKVQIYRLQRNPIRPMPVMGFRVSKRSFLRLALEDSRGKRYVDCSPLPHLHRETLDDCLEAAKLYFQDKRVTLPVSLSTALHFLSEEENPPKDGLWENSALVSLGMPVPLEARVCKVKVGAHDLSEARVYLKALRTEREDREFRLDFNQALEESSYDELKRLLKDLPVAYIEEPFSSVTKLKEFARNFPLALDEHLGVDDELDRLAKAWVIKPNVLGYDRAKKRFQDKSDVQKILSNVFESAESLQLYAAVYRNWTEKPKALGFGTAFYFPSRDEEWNPAVFQGPWPSRLFSQADFEGDLLWQN